MQKLFTYPSEFKLYPEHQAHSGQAVEVVRELIDGEEYDGPLAGLPERMFLIRADDGWEGHAFETELS